MTAPKTTVLEIDDYEWWERQTADDNPYGGKIWPGAIAAATRLVELAATDELAGLSVIEIGAGNGFCSLAAAALPGPRSVLATDISEMSLELIRCEEGKRKGAKLTTLTTILCRYPLPPRFNPAWTSFTPALALTIAHTITTTTTTITPLPPSRPSFTPTCSPLLTTTAAVTILNLRCSLLNLLTAQLAHC